MARIIIEYDGRDAVVKKALDLLLSLKSVKIKPIESTYNPEFVSKIKKTEKQESKSVDLEKYGISI